MKTKLIKGAMMHDAVPYFYSWNIDTHSFRFEYVKLNSKVLIKIINIDLFDSIVILFIKNQSNNEYELSKMSYVLKITKLLQILLINKIVIIINNNIHLTNSTLLKLL